MSSLFDDLPARNFKFSDDDEKLKLTTERLLVILGPIFFAKRDKDNKAERPYVRSEIVWQQVEARWDRVVTLMGVDDQRLQQGYQQLVMGDRKIHIDAVTVDTTDIGASTQRVIDYLRGRGIRMALPRNRRTVSWVNLQKFVSAGQSVTFVGEDDHVSIGVEPEKELTFKDLADKRARSGWD
jgi:hypothetical protein